MKKASNLIINGLRAVMLASFIFTMVRGLISLTGGAMDSSHYFSAAASSMIGFLLTLIPVFLVRKNILAIPPIIQTLYSVFVFCAMFGGDVLNFYNTVSWWDSFLHLTSGALFSAIGYLVFVSINRNADVRNQLHPVTAIMFAVCFALAAGVVWEIYEFAADCLFGMNMQRWQNTMSVEQWASLQHVSNFSQPGLIDSMKDMILDTMGAIFSIPILLPMIRRGNRYVKTTISTQQVQAATWTPIPSAAADSLDLEDETLEKAA